jgi:acyl-CoA synthetase (AMP-forming)/AMP-acid ligase II/thioesterase domain-containing protein/acyl carrier protein
VVSSTSESKAAPEVRTIAQLIGQAKGCALLAPGRAVLFYQDLRNQIKEVAEVLNSFGIGRSDRVAIVIPQGPEMAVGVLAVAACATAIPLNPNFRRAEFEFYFSNIRPKALLTQFRFDSPAGEVARKHGISVVELYPDYEGPAGCFRLSADFIGEPVESGLAEPNDIALVLYTSGTSGNPKRVPLTQSNICISARNIRNSLDLTFSDRCLNVMPLFHIHGLVGALLSSLSAGASVVCPPQFRSADFLPWVTEFVPTWYSAVPTIHQAVLKEAIVQRHDLGLTSLQFVRSCSSALPARVMARLEETFNIPVVEAYGMTEASHQIASNPLPPAKRKPGFVGVPTGPEVAVMDDNRVLLPPGRVGEVVIRGQNVMSGYEDNPDANRVSFSNGWFRTGDQGYIDSDGYIRLNGRLKEIINRGGEKISPREIDDVLMKHPAVSCSVTYPMPHETLGEDVAAAVIPEKDNSVQETELRRFAAKELADFKIPSKILVVNDIPTGATGKIDRSSLARKLGDLRKEEFAAPLTRIEEELAKLWMQLLRVDRVGIRDSFFDLGGDSVTASELVARVERLYHKKLSISALILAPTIDQLAKFIEQSGPTKAASSLVAIQPSGVRLPFFCVHGHDGNVFGFHDLARRLGSGYPFFGLQSQGLDAVMPPLTQVEEMASHYIEEIRRRQNCGPYLLGGFCSGGVIAFEMAQQLGGQGQTVKLLVLIDTYGPGYPEPLPLIPRFCSEISHHVRELAGLKARDILPYISGRGVRRLKRLEGLIKRKLSGASAGRLHMDKSVPGYPALYIAKLNRRATGKYTPRPYPGRVALFRARQPEWCRPNHELGWSNFVSGGVVVVDVPSDHDQMLQNQVLVSQLKEFIDQASEKPPDEKRTRI